MSKSSSDTVGIVTERNGWMVHEGLVLFKVSRLSFHAKNG